MIRVINFYKATQEERAAAIYIGRYSNMHALLASPLANPYKLMDMSRERTLEFYRKWLWGRIAEQGRAYQELVRIAELVKAGDEVTLMCFCSPEPCHGNVIVKAIEWMLREGKA